MRVPGKENKRAAVAWCRNDGEALKYAGRVAAYMRTESVLNE